MTSLDLNSISYLDSGLAPQTCYSYQIRAQGQDTYSAYSNEASASTTITPGGDTGPATDKIIAGYFPAWGIYNARKYWVSYIPFDRITHVNYAFANVDSGSLQEGARHAHTSLDHGTGQIFEIVGVIHIPCIQDGVSPQVAQQVHAQHRVPQFAAV